MGALIGASESQQAPGGSGGSHWVQLVQVVSEGLKGVCDLIAFYHRVDKAWPAEDLPYGVRSSTASSDLHDAIVANSCSEETISTS